MSMKIDEEVTSPELEKIRRLTDHNLKVIIHETHYHGWPVARKALAAMMPIKLRDK